MKQILSILFLLTLASFGASGQAWTNDTITMNPGLSQNVYYQMSSNGSVKNEPSTNWHLALSLSISDSASIFANHGAGNEFTKVYNIHKAAADWNNIVLGDTANADALYNGSESWHQGAFNDNPNPSGFHFGWGVYNPADNVIRGDSVFIVRTGTAHYKFMVDSLVSQAPYTWHLRVQKFDLIGMTQTYTVVGAPTYSDRLFAYFNLDSGQDLDREPAIDDWDLVFTTYPEEVFGGPPPQQLALYAVTGALSNKGILVSEVQNMDVDDAFNDGYNQFWNAPPAKAINTIGWDWKNPPMGPPPAAYTMVDSLSYFIKNKANDIYQLQFLGYGGSTTGEIIFRKRLLGSVVAVNDVNNQIEDYKLFPNPANASANLVFTANEAAMANVTIYDFNGRAVKSMNKQASNGLNAWNINTSELANGTYIIHLSVGDGFVKEKMTILR